MSATSVTSAAQAVSRAMETRGVTVDEARYRLGNMGKTLFYDLVKQKKIRIVKLGNRTVVPMSEIDRLLSGEDDGA